MMRARFIIAVLAALAAAFSSTVAAQERGDPGRGRDYAEAHCAECHEVRPGHYDSPIMQAPPFVDIANDPRMTAVALFPFFQTSHVSMPNFVVPPDDIRDLTAYILTLRQ